jgi:hypothetical protein
VTLLLGGTALGVVLRYKAKIKELQVGQHGGDRDADRVDFDAITKVLTDQRDEAWAHIECRTSASTRWRRRSKGYD